MSVDGSDAQGDAPAGVDAPIETVSAVTLATHDMARVTAFYEALGFVRIYGGPEAAFTSYRTGAAFLNIIAVDPTVQWSWWGRVIFHVRDVDALYGRAITHGLHPTAPPANAPWGERYFHIVAPDGHELSFAVRLDSSRR